MPEISEQDFAALAAQVASLSSALAVARRRIDDLEDGMTGHLGLDWGESLVDVNSPHPNISANTIESGGGIIKQALDGMQVRASATQAAIWWLYRLVDDARTLSGGSTNYGFLDGYVPAESGGEVSVSLTAVSAGSALASISIQANDASSFARAVITGGLSFDQELVLTGVISPTQILANQNNYNPTGLDTATIVRLSSDASRDITGIVPPDSGKAIAALNVGSFNIVLKDESASSTAANRFALQGDITIPPDGAAILWYDSTSSRWRCVGTY